MKLPHLAAALVCASSLANAVAEELPTTGTLESPIGKLEIKNGYPTDSTVVKLYDELDFQRACQIYLWALPYMAMAEWQRQQREIFGAGHLDYVDYLNFTDKLGIITANATTPYAMSFPNLAETGPLVFEIPAGAMAGGILDFWQRPMTDCGQTGPDKGRGGKFLILGPNDHDMTVDDYYIFRSATNNIWCGMRGLDADIGQHHRGGHLELIVFERDRDVGRVGSGHDSASANSQNEKARQQVSSGDPSPG